MPTANHPQAIEPLELNEAHNPRARTALVQRLCEIVSWPESRIPAHERQLAADILVGLLRTSSVDLRKRCAEGLEGSVLTDLYPSTRAAWSKPRSR